MLNYDSEDYKTRTASFSSDFFLLYSPHLHFYFPLFYYFVSVLVSAISFSLPEIFLSVFPAMSTFPSPSNADPAISTIAYPPSLNNSGAVVRSPSFHSGTQTAVEIIVTKPDEQIIKRAAREATQDQPPSS